MTAQDKAKLERIGVSEALADSATNTAEYLHFMADAHRLRAEFGSLAAGEQEFIDTVRRIRLDEYELGWEYCYQQQYNRLRKRVRARQLRFIVAWSIIAVIITFWAMRLKG